MWLMTRHGFYSIVQKNPGEFHVRTRVRRDLENLIERVPLPGQKVHTSKATDYPHRIIVDKEGVLKVLLFLGETLDYGNFKGMIHETKDQRSKSAVYGRVWRALFEEFGGYGLIGRNSGRDTT